MTKIYVVNKYHQFITVNSTQLFHKLLTNMFELCARANYYVDRDELCVVREKNYYTILQ